MGHLIDNWMEDGPVGLLAMLGCVGLVFVLITTAIQAQPIAKIRIQLRPFYTAEFGFVACTLLGVVYSFERRVICISLPCLNVYLKLKDK